MSEVPHRQVHKRNDGRDVHTVLKELIDPEEKEVAGRPLIVPEANGQPECVRTQHVVRDFYRVFVVVVKDSKLIEIRLPRFQIFLRRIAKVLRLDARP